MFTMHRAGQDRQMWTGSVVTRSWRLEGRDSIEAFFFSLGHGLKRHGAHKWFSECTISRFLQDSCVGFEDKVGWVC